MGLSQQITRQSGIDRLPDPVYRSPLRFIYFQYQKLNDYGNSKGDTSSIDVNGRNFF